MSPETVRACGDSQAAEHVQHECWNYNVFVSLNIFHIYDENVLLVISYVQLTVYFFSISKMIWPPLTPLSIINSSFIHRTDEKEEKDVQKVP